MRPWWLVDSQGGSPVKKLEFGDMEINMGVVPAGIVQDYSHRGYRIGEYVFLAFKIDNSDKVTTLDKTFLNDNTVSQC